MHGVTKDVPIEFQFTPGQRTQSSTGSAKLNRLDFGVGQGDWKSTETIGRRENQFLPGAEAQELTWRAYFDDVAECVEDTLSRVGPHIVLALPLGMGKPNPLANEFYRRARRDASISLKIFTALSLRAPQWKGELERRFLQPLVERLFGACVPLDYVTDLHGGGVPDNVQIVEFFLDPGALLNVGHSQRHYVSSNYTHVARDVAAQGVNVLGQLVAKRSVEGRTEYSLGSNPDVTVDLLALWRRSGRQAAS